MSDKRMFSKQIIGSDAFLEMPLSAQALYFHLGMEADDDGFLNNPNRMTKIVGANVDDLKLLIAKKFIIAFESGVVVIKHWFMNNYIREDRKQPTVYQTELAQLAIKENKAYTLSANGLTNDNQMDGISQPKLNKVKLNKVKLDKVSVNSNSDGFVENAIMQHNPQYDLLERLITSSYLPNKRGQQLSYLEGNLIIDWLKQYSYEYIEEKIKSCALQPESKRSMAYLKGAIEKGSPKQVETKVEEHTQQSVDDAFAELKKLKEKRGN